MWRELRCVEASEAQASVLFRAGQRSTTRADVWRTGWCSRTRELARRTLFAASGMVGRGRGAGDGVGELGGTEDDVEDVGHGQAPALFAIQTRPIRQLRYIHTQPLIRGLSDTNQATLFALLRARARTLILPSNHRALLRRRTRSLFLNHFRLPDFLHPDHNPDSHWEGPSSAVPRPARGRARALHATRRLAYRRGAYALCE